MEPVLDEVEKVLRALEEAGVRYLVVGGVAAVLHGYVRATMDLDLVVQLDPPNVRRAVESVTGLGFRPRVPEPALAFADPECRERWRREKGMLAFSLFDPAEPWFHVDLFVTEPFDFDEAYVRAERLPLHGLEAPVLSSPDLIRMKRDSPRPSDHRDADVLETLQERAERDRGDA